MALDDRTELYRHYDAAGRLLYVGISLDATVRLQGHRVKSWFDLVSFITIERFSTRTEALTAERDAILKEEPEFNRVYRTSKEVEEFRLYLEELES